MCMVSYRLYCGFPMLHLAEILLVVCSLFNFLFMESDSDVEIVFIQKSRHGIIEVEDTIVLVS